jgi:hypothetical protein
MKSEGPSTAGEAGDIRSRYCTRSRAICGVLPTTRSAASTILDAVEEPMRWFATNAGHEGSTVVQLTSERDQDEGFNTRGERNLVHAGRDRSHQGGPIALQNAASIASLR